MNAKPKRARVLLDEETKAAMRRDRAAGLRYQAIAAKHGVPYSTAYGTCTGVSYSKGASSERETVRLPLGEVRDLVARGWDARRIAEWLGCARDSIPILLSRNAEIRLCSVVGCESTVIDSPICALHLPRFEAAPRGGMPRWLRDAYANDRTGGCHD